MGSIADIDHLLGVSLSTIGPKAIHRFSGAIESVAARAGVPVEKRNPAKKGLGGKMLEQASDAAEYGIRSRLSV